MTLAKYLFGAVAALAVLTLFLIDPALAQEAAEAAAEPAARHSTPAIRPGCSPPRRIVLMMTIPGLALFYGGMVRKKNVLSVVMQCFAITCLITIVWFLVGYSLAFTDGGEPQLLYRRAVEGSCSRASASDSPRRCTIPESVFFTFQTDLRHHHAGAHRRRVRRPHEVLRAGPVHGAVVADRLCADHALGMGRRLPWRRGRARLRRRHGRAYQCRHRRPGHAPSSSANAPATARRTWRRITWSTA